MDISLREWLQGCAGPDGGDDWFTQTDLKINQLLYKVAQLENKLNQPQVINFSFMLSFYMEGTRTGGHGAMDNMYAPKLKTDGDGDTSIIASGGNGISESWYVPVNCALTKVITAHPSVYNADISQPPFLTIKRGQYSFPGTNSWASASEVARITQQITDVNIPFDRGTVFWIGSYFRRANDGVVGDYIPLGGWTTCLFTARV